MSETHSVHVVMYSDILTLDTNRKRHNMSGSPLEILHYLVSILLYPSDSISVGERFARRVPQKLHVPAEAAH